MLSFTDYFPQSHWIIHALSLNSKMFGNGSTDTSGATDKRIRITTNTTYKLMVRQGQQEGNTDQVGPIPNIW